MVCSASWAKGPQRVASHRLFSPSMRGAVTSWHIDLGHRPFRGALVDLSGRIHERVEADPVDTAPVGEKAHEVAVDLIETLIAKSTAPVLGIGVGAPGVINPEGTILEATNLDWHGFDLGRRVTASVRHPCLDCQRRRHGGSCSSSAAAPPTAISSWSSSAVVLGPGSSSMEPSIAGSIRPRVRSATSE